MSSTDPVDEIEELDSVHVDALLKAVEKAGEKANTTIRIFERNDYYYYFHSDAELAAKFIYGSAKAVKTMGKKNQTNFCVMKYANFESLLRHILLVRHLRVEIYKFNAGKAGSAPSYSLEVRASPGNTAAIEHILYGENDTGSRDTNFLAGVNFSTEGGQTTIGLAAVDTCLNMVKVVQFKDDQILSGLEAFLVQLGPREVILPQLENQAIKKICELITRNKILVTERPTKDFTPLNEVEIKEVFTSKSPTNLLSSQNIVSGCLNAVFNYLNFDTSAAKFSLESLSSSTYMKLANRSLTSLNVFPTQVAPNAPSIFSILNQTRTPGGARMLAQWLKQPLLDADLITERLDLVEMLVNNTELRQMLFEEHLRKFPDYQRLAAKFGSSKANLQDMYRVYVSISKLEPLVECLQENCGEESNNYAVLQDNFIKDLQELQKDFEKFSQMVETTIDLNQVEHGHFMIKPDFDDNLGELREQLDLVDVKIKAQESKAATELDIEKGKVLKLEHNSQYGYYFRVTLKEEKSVRGNKNYTIIEANKSGIKFRNGKLEQLNETFADLSSKYEEQQKSIVAEMVSISSGYGEPMTNLGNIISRLDVVTSLAMAAVSAPVQFCRPRVSVAAESPSSKIHITGCRHPIVELQDNCNYIPNDVDLNPESLIHIITGPNMGGKSTYLRSIGCAVLMAQCGSFVAAESAELSVVDSIMVRIGASDCQMEGVSTFMSEMVETHSILASASSSTLVLIDELGRGTSTYDGFGLAWAVSQHIARELKCPTLFTTHYTELTELADQEPNVTNYHVTALVGDDKLTLLYQLQPGVCSKSFGIDVAKIAHFPTHVIDDAKRRIWRLEGVTETSETPSELKQKIVEEGNRAISEFLEKAKGLESEESDDELLRKFSELKQEIKNSDIPYVKCFT